jgi:hypothetical protein
VTVIAQGKSTIEGTVNNAGTENVRVYLYVKLGQTGENGEAGEIGKIQVINTAGAIVHTQTITNPDETIHLGHLPAGMYVIRLENTGTVKALKAIKIQ